MATDICSKYWIGLLFGCRRVSLEFVLETVEPIRIGTSRVGKRLPILRYNLPGKSRAVPVIPGSSIKGVLRTASLQACNHCNLTAHSGVEKDNCISLLEKQVSNIVKNKKKKKKDKIEFDDYRKKASIDSLSIVLQGLCPTCLLYGASSISSRVFVSDFLAIEKKYSTNIRTCVVIDRRRGAAVRHYEVEYIEPNSQFIGNIILLNTPNWMLSLFAASLLAIHDGWLKIGGFKSRGMGRVRIVENSLVVRLQGMGISRDRLEPLDADIDVVDDISDCSCNVADGALVCQGGSAMALLRKLADRWYSLYCGRVKSVWEKRFQVAVKEVIEVVEGDDGG